MSYYYNRRTGLTPQPKFKMNNDPEWLMAMSEKEEAVGGSISAGTLGRVKFSAAIVVQNSGIIDRMIVFNSWNSEAVGNRAEIEFIKQVKDEDAKHRHQVTQEMIEVALDDGYIDVTPTCMVSIVWPDVVEIQ